MYTLNDLFGISDREEEDFIPKGRFLSQAQSDRIKEQSEDYQYTEDLKERTKDQEGVYLDKVPLTGLMSRQNVDKDEEEDVYAEIERSLETQEAWEALRNKWRKGAYPFMFKGTKDHIDSLQ